jgi:two-component system sensor histidine kinase HydH
MRYIQESRDGYQASLGRLCDGCASICAALDVDGVTHAIPEVALQVLGAEAAVLHLADGESGPLRLAARRGEAADPAAADLLAAAAWSGEMPAVIPDLRQDPRFAGVALDHAVSALAVVLRREGQGLGTLSVFRREAEGAGFGEPEQDLLMHLATHAVVALENARYFSALSLRAEELDALREIGQAITRRLELSAVLEAVAAGAIRLLGVQHSQILLWDEATESLRYGAAIGAEAERVRAQRFQRGRGINMTVARSRQPMLLNDYQGSPYALPEFPDVVATMTAPVLFGDRLLGVLHSHSTRPDKRYTPDDLRRLNMLATQAAIAIENARLFEEAQVRSARLAALSELSRRVTSSLELQQVFDYVVRATVDLLGLALARVWVWQEDTSLLHLRASAGDPDLLPPPRHSFHPGEGITGTAFQTHAITTVPDAGLDAGYAEQVWAREHGVKAVAVVPLMRGAGALGVVSVGRREDRPFAADEIDLLRSFAQHAAIAIENARLFQETERLARANLVRLRKISILNEIGLAMQGTMRLDELLQVILTGVTFGGGLGFNRALVLLVDEARGVLQGRMGVGPSTGEEAAQAWQALSVHTMSLREIVAERIAHLAEEAERPFARLARSLVIPLQPEAGVLALTALEGRPFRIADAREDARVHPDRSGRLGVEEFASVPLIAKGKVVGVMVVDNKFNRRPITDEDLEFLALFATHAGLAVESAQVYTRLEEASRELRRTQHELIRNERLAALGEMAAHVVHEIRNPLVSIGGFARRLARRLGGKEPEGPYAEIVSREVDRLERIVRDVQSLSREMRPALVHTDLHALLQECLVLFGERMGQQRVQLKMDLGQRPQILLLDPVQTKQAVLNLVSNALEAMGSGGTLTVTTQDVRGGQGRLADALPLRAAPVTAGDEPAAPSEAEQGTGRAADGEWVVLSIADTGGGIPEEIVGEIFNPFFTTKDTGTGLGLALVRRVARAHGGHVEVENRPGEGVTFRLWFPLPPASGQAERP